MLNLDRRPLGYIAISAVLFGVSPPLAKLLVKSIPPVALAGFLYFGAFIGLSLYSITQRIINAESGRTASLRKEDFPWLIGAIVSGGIAAPICLMFGLSCISGFAASLLLNLEGIFTAIIAVMFFGENAGKRVWLALMCMSTAGVFLTWDSSQGRFSSLGPLLVTLSMICWGIDNNLTRNISARNPTQITRIKGFASGLVSIALAYILRMEITWNVSIVFALLLGASSYGISLVFFIKALEGLGSFRAGMFFSLAPFVGAVTSLLLLQEWIGWVMFPAILLTITGFWLMSTEQHEHVHSHPEDVHNHLHDHDDIHHAHDHPERTGDGHTHEHRHLEEDHFHSHWPDTHHRHEH
jgi:drug/metabolite transporter (DMT)-like permease